MTDKYALESNLSPLLRKMFALLAELDGSRQGEVFRDHIKQTLVEWEANQTKTINTYVSLVNLLLDAFASQLPPDSVALSHLKLIQTCLTPPLSDAELVALQQNVEEAADILRHSCLINIDELNESLMPMLKRVTGMPGDKEEVHFPQPTSKEIKKGYEDALDEEQQNVEAESEFSGKNVSIQETANELEKNLAPELTPEKGFAKPKLVESATLDSDFDLDTNQSIQDQEFSDVENDGEQQNIFDNIKAANLGFSGERDESKPLKAPKAVLKMLRFPENSQQGYEDLELQEEFLEGTSETDGLVDDYHMYDDIGDESTDEGSLGQEDIGVNTESYDKDEMEKLHRDFVKQMRSVVAENTEFGVHLGLEIDALDEATKINQIDDRKKTILASMKKISESHTELAKKFDAAQSYLSVIESDKRKLSDELDRARMLSLTDDLTSLPNRRAFIRRLDDEVSRVKRYGFPLSLVLIDIDHFKQVNDKYGHAAGDNVLRIYAEKILSIFRHHDMIARYGGEEFAVLLPNTDLEGVLRALDKVKSSVPNVKCNFNGETIPAPTFSAGVTEYRAPESPSQLIERADHALYRAKRLGRDRIEVEQKSQEHDTIDHS